MKRILSALALAAILGNASAQDKQNETIEGNGKLVTRDINVQPFDALNASGVYELKLVQGDKESVKIEADENLQELFTVKNDGSQLNIEMKKNISLRGKMRVKVYVTFRNLKSIELSTVGNVSTEKQLTFSDLILKNKSVGNVNLNFTANKLDLKNTSVGNLKLQGKAQTAVFKNSGVGNLRAGELIVQSMDIDNSGVGNAEVNAEKELKVSDNMLGRVTNKGAAPMKKSNKVVI
ncbi:MAG TPA: head GIN domain-containing protein [Chitinophagaceae bacterium]|nr:head GIN domain-containing protein [Chitinophagaceae bacterium]